MTEQKLQRTVAEAIAVDRQIRDLEVTLKSLKAELVSEAASRPDEHTNTDNGGTSWTAGAEDVGIVRVTFPAPSLKSRIDGEAKGFDKVKAAAGSAFDRLFRPVLAYRPVDKFRAEAEAVLGRQAAKLVRLCETEGTPKVQFETKKEA